MKLGGKFIVIMVALGFIFASAYVAKAAADDREPTAPAPASFGAVRVDRDFGAFHKDDSNQFGDDRAYNSSQGLVNRESDYQAHHWIPDTYGQMGNYGYDSGN
jgi:hypothetical protein